MSTPNDGTVHANGKKVPIPVKRAQLYSEHLNENKEIVDVGITTEDLKRIKSYDKEYEDYYKNELNDIKEKVQFPGESADGFIERSSTVDFGVLYVSVKFIGDCNEIKLMNMIEQLIIHMKVQDTIKEEEIARAVLWAASKWGKLNEV